jgi:hypothetical protein
LGKQKGYQYDPWWPPLLFLVRNYIFDDINMTLPSSKMITFLTRKKVEATKQKEEKSK